MMFAENKAKTVENIRLAAERGDFHATVEPDDPVLTKDEAVKLANKHMEYRKSFGYRIKRFFAEAIANAATKKLHAKTEIVGLEKLQLLPRGSVFTSMHYHPLDSTAVRKVISEIGGGKLNIVSKISNFAMSGFVGFLMNYTRTVPIVDEPHYLARALSPAIKDMLARGEYVLIYPEGSMWFNYKKPRPHLPGAYYYAAKNFVPLAPIFTEMQESGKEIIYRIHVGDPIFPDIEKTPRENAHDMWEADTRFKRETYERVYGRSIELEFSDQDVAEYAELIAPENNPET